MTVAGWPWASTCSTVRQPELAVVRLLARCEQVQARRWPRRRAPARTSASNRRPMPRPAPSVRRRGWPARARRPGSRRARRRAMRLIEPSRASMSRRLALERHPGGRDPARRRHGQEFGERGRLRPSRRRDGPIRLRATGRGPARPAMHSASSTSSTRRLRADSGDGASRRRWLTRVAHLRRWPGCRLPRPARRRGGRTAPGPASCTGSSLGQGQPPNRVRR